MKLVAVSHLRSCMAVILSYPLGLERFKGLTSIITLIGLVILLLSLKKRTPGLKRSRFKWKRLGFVAKFHTTDSLMDLEGSFFLSAISYPSPRAVEISIQTATLRGFPSYPSSPNPPHRETDPKSCQIKYNLDCNHSFPMDLLPNSIVKLIVYGSKSFRKV